MSRLFVVFVYVGIEYLLLSYYLQKQMHIRFCHLCLFLHVNCIYLSHYYVLVLSLILHLGDQVYKITISLFGTLSTAVCKPS